jgi:hypothetical protein
MNVRIVFIDNIIALLSSVFLRMVNTFGAQFALELAVLQNFGCESKLATLLWGARGIRKEAKRSGYEKIFAGSHNDSITGDDPVGISG